MLIGANITTSPYSLLGAEGVESVEDLRGATIGVTSEGSSADYFTSLLMLRNHDMEHGTDFDYVNAGPPSERASAMATGELQAVMNFEPDALRLIEGGAKVLDRAADYENLKGVEVNSLAATTTWYEANRDLAENFVRGYLASLEWLYDEANRDRAEGILADRMELESQQRRPPMSGSSSSWRRGTPTARSIPSGWSRPDPMPRRRGWRCLERKSWRTGSTTRSWKPPPTSDRAAAAEIGEGANPVAGCRRGCPDRPFGRPGTGSVVGLEAPAVPPL